MRKKARSGRTRSLPIKKETIRTLTTGHLAEANGAGFDMKIMCPTTNVSCTETQQTKSPGDTNER